VSSAANYLKINKNLNLINMPTVHISAFECISMHVLVTG
jgi:hypothetical protein